MWCPVMAAPAHRASVCAAPEAVHSPWSVPFPPSAKPEMSHLSDPLFVVTHLYPRPGKSLQSKGITPLPGAHLDEPGEAPRLKVLTSTLVAKTLCHSSYGISGLSLCRQINLSTTQRTLCETFAETETTFKDNGDRLMNTSFSHSFHN